MGECFAFCGDEVLLSSHSCPHRLNFRRPTPSSHRGGPTPSSLPRNVHSGPGRRPTPFSSSTVYIPLGCRFCFLDTPGVHGAKILTEHFVPHFPIFSHTKLLLSLFQRKNKGRLINWVLFVSSCTYVSITAWLVHTPKTYTQSGNFQFGIKSPSDFKILSARKLKTLFQKYKLELITGIYAWIGHVLRKY